MYSNASRNGRGSAEFAFYYLILLACFASALGFDYDSSHHVALLHPRPCSITHQTFFNRRLCSSPGNSFVDDDIQTRLSYEIKCFLSPQESISCSEQITSPETAFVDVLRPTSALPVQESSQLRRKHLAKRKVQWVPWAGKRGMLPHQHYSGVLKYQDYEYWHRASYAPSNSSLSNSTSEVRPDQIQSEPHSINPSHLTPIYIDAHIIVMNKPSGILSVPGPRRHECVATLAYRYFGKSYLNHEDKEPSSSLADECAENEINWIEKSFDNNDNKHIDKMIVHRLDRDTSGVFLLARNDEALTRLHDDFKDKSKQRVRKKYVALVCGHWGRYDSETFSADNVYREGGYGRAPFAKDEGEIDLPLVRDLERPPFMRVETMETMQQRIEFDAMPSSSQREKSDSGKKDSITRWQHSGFLRMVGKAAKPSLTTYRILSYEYLVHSHKGTSDDDSSCTSSSHSSFSYLPVTRVELQPITGRTHQLRVHCAAVGHPIVGDSIYGYNGEGSPDGGLLNKEPRCSASDGRASLELQKEIHDYWTQRKQSERNKQTKQPLHENHSTNCSPNREEECMLCLHAQTLSIFHPFTGAPMLFESQPPF